MASSSGHIDSPEQIDLFFVLSQFGAALSKLWAFVLIIVLLCSGITFSHERRTFRPQYQCSAVFSVDSNYTNSSTLFSSSYYYDSVAAQNIAESFPHLLGTEFMQDLIAGQLEDGVIRGSISASAIPNTSMVEIAVVSSTPEDAYHVLLAVLAAYPRAAVYMVDNPVLYIREEPTLPTEPIAAFSPRSAALKGALYGCILGLGITAIYSLLTTSVHSADDLRRLVTLPVWASCPLVRSKKRRSVNRSFVSGSDSPALAEALRSLRVRVRKHLAQHDGQVILLTSTVSGEGKSTLCANLALSLAAEGHRVVLLDADLRNQSVVQLFGGNKNNAGLAQLLKKPDQALEKYLQTAPESTLRYISGVSTKKRHYAIDAKALAQILDRLCAGFDYVVVDTPPCTVVSDTTLLCHCADAVLYVVRSDYATRPQILDGVTMLHQAGAPLAGCVVNGVKERRSHYGYGYGYGYGSKYGYGKKYGRSFSSYPDGEKTDSAR